MAIFKHAKALIDVFP